MKTPRFHSAWAPCSPPRLDIDAEKRDDRDAKGVSSPLPTCQLINILTPFWIIKLTDRENEWWIVNPTNRNWVTAKPKQLRNIDTTIKWQVLSVDIISIKQYRMLIVHLWFEHYGLLAAQGFLSAHPNLFPYFEQRDSWKRGWNVNFTKWSQKKRRWER